jgi:ABC-type lipoprotein release transport system permease subunit
MCVLALAIATASARHSFDQALANELDATFGWDLSLIAASTFTDDFAAAAASVEGVAAVAPVAETLGSFTVDGRRELAQIRGIDQRYFDVSGFRWVEGDDASGRRALGTRGSVLFPKATAARLGLHAGDDLTFETDQGPRPLHIAAVVTYSNAVPTMFVGADTASTYFGASAPGQLLVKVRPGVATDDVRGRLQTTLASKATFIVGTVSDVKADIRDQIAAGVNGFQLLLLLAGVVGLLGLGNTLVVSAVQRYRETGIIRALGARRSQVAAASLVEALTLALAAVVLAIPLGALIGAPVVRAVVHGVGDLSITYRFAWSALPPLVLITLAVAATCSILPARRATKLDIDAALRFE